MNKPHQITHYYFFLLLFRGHLCEQPRKSHPDRLLLLHVLPAGLDIRQMCSLNNPLIIIIVMYAWLIKFLCYSRLLRHPAEEFGCGMLCLFICCEITWIIIIIVYLLKARNCNCLFDQSNEEKSIRSHKSGKRNMKEGARTKQQFIETLIWRVSNRIMNNNKFLNFKCVLAFTSRSLWIYCLLQKIFFEWSYGEISLFNFEQKLLFCQRNV